MESSENQKIETTNEEQQKENNQSKQFYTNKWFYINLFIALLVIVGFTLYFLSLPFKSENVSCKYKSKYNKIECIQTGDIVPNWLNLDNVDFLNYLGLETNYSMKIIFEHNKQDYIVLNMSKKELIPGLNRKFVYELNEQTFNDWIKFKTFTEKEGTRYSNWGSVILYCSESNLKEDVCKRLKKQYKK